METPESLSVFPDWSPKDLIAYYYLINYKSGDPNPELSWFVSPIEEKILLEILTNPDMEMVWNAFNKEKSKIIYDEQQELFHPMMFFQCVDKAHGESIYSDLSTKNDDVKKYQEIAKKTRELIKLLTNTDLDMSCQLIKYYSDDEILEMFKTYCYFETNEPVLYKVMPEQTLSSALKDVALKADEQSKIEANRVRISKNKDTAQSTKFIRAIYPYWLDVFKTPRRRILAALCRVIFDDPAICEDTINNALKSIKTDAKNYPRDL